MLCAIWCHMYNLKKVKNTHGGVLLLAKLSPSGFNFNKRMTSLECFSSFLNWKYIRYHIASYMNITHCFPEEFFNPLMAGGNKMVTHT